MKMVKSLLLGTAAGLVAMTGAQAADLPVKAKPVQYVKICSLYGAGYYYIPGTDTCIKVGGFVRAEYNLNANGSFNPIIRQNYNRLGNDVTARTRAAISLDVRNQTEYGTLRSYFQGGWTVTNGGGAAPATYGPRAFIQLAGFTAGLAESFFDAFSFVRYSNQTNVLTSDTSGNGIITFAYTATLGNGLSASVAIEDQAMRRTIINGTSAYGGTGIPDVVANLRVDQAWGSAQIMGALHEVKPSYVTFQTTHHDNKLGWAVGGFLSFNLPTGKGDKIEAQGAYAKGATGYNFRGGSFAITHGAQTGIGAVADATTGPITGGVELTESWSVGVGAQHGWNSMWKTSLYGGYGAVNYSNTAETYLGTAAGLSSDFSFWQIGSRTVWTPVANLDLSVDVMYNHLDTATAGVPVFAGTALSDQDIWMAIFRVQRNFWP